MLRIKGLTRAKNELVRYNRRVSNWNKKMYSANTKCIKRTKITNSSNDETKTNQTTPLNNISVSKNAEDPHTNVNERESLQIFELAWNQLKKKKGAENMTFPKEILFLAGAPGAGKGEMNSFIKKVRGISSKTIEISQLLTSPEAEAIKSKGALVDDRLVVQLLLTELLEKEYTSGVIVDGFPRTQVQAECIKHLYDKMIDLKSLYANTIHNDKFYRPIFNITVLFIEEDLSISRQLSRGDKVKEHNRRVEETGYGKPMALRKTDVDPELARKRFQDFKKHYTSLGAIKSYFNFHIILADAEPEVVKSRILKELDYQSSTELQEATFEKVRRLPLASEVTRDARREMIRRLDDYAKNHSVLLDQIVEFLERDFFTIIRENALAGKVLIRSENPILKQKHAVRMALDLFAERGFIVFLDIQKLKTPRRIINGEIELEDSSVHQFTIEFPKPSIRTNEQFMI